MHHPGPTGLIIDRPQKSFLSSQYLIPALLTENWELAYRSDQRCEYFGNGELYFKH